MLGYYIMMGNFDARLHVVARNMRDYSEFYLEHLAALPHISEISSMTVMSKLKDADIPV